MKINIKRQILQAIASIEECHEVIRSIEDAEQLIELLGLCQKLALSVGETLEQRETLVDVAQRIVAQLEDYCEYIYKLGCAENMGGEAYFDILKACCAKLQQIKISITSDVPEQKQVVVFLPYIASMWDSLDSICREALKSENWETYVMPAPYYSLNKQGKPIADICEYDKFPQDLPLVHYKTRTLESLQPDLIFYHNPYDDINLVTCVHPEFFSRNLKEITPYLVYVPYYFAAEKTMKHMPDMPGVKNAWRVVVQEEVAEQFLEKYPKEKVLAFGSPKLDALFNVDAKNIPEDWQKKIEGKTVLLFNTHIKSAMNDPSKFFDMLDYVMDIMENDEDIVVLWRPHPLTQQTLNSFHDNKNLLRQYNKRVSEFKLLSNGIYDDTVDLHRSLAISDGYMGTCRSSVYTLYKELNKPVYIIPDVYEKNWWETKLMYANRGGVFVQGYIWQFNLVFNAIVKYDPTTKKSWYVASLDRFPLFEPAMFYATDISGDWLVLVPWFKKYVALYNIVSSEIKYIELENEDFTEPQWITSYVNKNQIVVVRKDSTDYHYVISTEDFSCKKVNIKEKGTYLRAADGYVWTHDKLYNKLIARNEDSCLTFLLPINCNFELFTHICISQGSLWVVNRKSGTLFYWKELNNSQLPSIFTILDLFKTNEDIRIRLCNVHDGKLLINTTHSDALYVIDMDSKICNQITPKTSEALARYSLDAFWCGEELHIMPCDCENNSIITIDSKLHKASRHRVTLENHDMLQDLFRFNLIGTGKDVMTAHLPWSAITWIDTVKAIDTNAHDNRNENSVGATAWRHIENEI